MPSPLLEGLYALTDVRLSGTSHIATAEALLNGGVRIIQLRDKEMSPRKYYETACEIKKLCSRYGALFIVNDRADIAMAAEADGVHIGQGDMPLSYARKRFGKTIGRKLERDLIIGVSTNSVEQAIKAQDNGADYIGFGPVFTTATKDAGMPLGLQSLKDARASLRLPIAAIGGITPDNACSVLEAGADMLAVASSVLVPGRVEEFARSFVGKIACL